MTEQQPGNSDLRLEIAALLAEVRLAMPGPGIGAGENFRYTSGYQHLRILPVLPSAWDPSSRQAESQWGLNYVAFRYGQYARLSDPGRYVVAASQGEAPGISWSQLMADIDALAGSGDQTGDTDG
jgi:hypothetical protein